MPEKALVVFDIDGTLLQADLITPAAVQQTFAAYGLPEPDTEIIFSFFGTPVENYHGWLASLCPPGKAEEIIAATDKRELELIVEEGRLYPGVREMLDALAAAGHAIACCSNGPVDYVDEAIDGHGLRGYFEEYRCRGMGYDGKTDMLRDVMACWGLSEHPKAGGPARVIMVGDREDDIAAARRNGARSIAAAYGFGSDEELADADAIVRHAGEIPEAVARLIR